MTGSGKEGPRRLDAKDLLLYAITDSSWLGGRSLRSCVEDALAAGATFIQMREKGASFAEQAALARELLPLCRKAGVPFVINDRVDLALEVGADGVHVGQKDMACAEARRLLGPDAIVGVSARTPEQALLAQEQGASYLGVGALAGTSTKLDAVNISREDLLRISSSVDIPLVGIGGLNARTIPQFAGCGLAGAAVVSAIFAADDVRAATRELREVCERTFA